MVRGPTLKGINLTRSLETSRSAAGIQKRSLASRVVGVPVLLICNTDVSIDIDSHGRQVIPVGEITKLCQPD